MFLLFTNVSVIATKEAIQSTQKYSTVKPGYIWIMANERNGILYTGVTNNLLRRIEEHKSGTIEGFSSKYKCKLCIYYEHFETIESAILREKQLKGGSRKKKLELIEAINPEWKDLTEEIKELV